jgi:hypothetical protein
MCSVKFTQRVASSVYGRLVRTRAALALTVVLLGSAAPSEAAPTRLRSCSTKADFNLLITSARNMFCRTARRDLRRHQGSIGFRFSTPGGFNCMRVSGTALGGQWRCVKGRKAYRFEFGD